MPRQIQKVRGLDFKTNQLQDNLTAAIQPFLTNPLNDGIIITDISLPGSSSVSVSHLLSRVPQGYIIIKKDAAADVYQESVNTRYLILNSTAAVTISIYVF